MRKLIAIALLAVLGLPFASSLFALTPKSEANLAACCRRNGKHHCMMSAGEPDQPASDKPALAAPTDKCPFVPSHSLIVPGRDLLGLVPASAIFVGLTSHPAVYPQVLAMGRISRDISNQKRGPPAA